MEATGFVIGLVGLASQLIQVSRECSIILGDMRGIGTAHNSLVYELRGAGLRLKEWEESWRFNHPSSSGSEPTQQLQALRLDPSNDKHRHAVECLAMIVATFTKIVQLQSNYNKYENKSVGVPVAPGDKQKEKWYERLRLPVGSRSTSRSRSPSMDRSAPPRDSDTAATINPQINVGLSENAEILSNPQCLQLQDEISRLSHAAQIVQNCLPEYRKLRWAFTDKGKADSLVGELRKYLDDLFTVLPPDLTTVQKSRIPPNSSMTKVTDLFAIPIVIPDVSRNADVVDRKDLLAELEREIAQETRHPIQVVLYGTGGMGKTHLALQYVSSHHTMYSSVFFVNGASQQTTRLAFTGIMQQLIEAYAQLSDQLNGCVDYADIGRQLGMAGKVDSSTGTFDVKEPGQEQDVIEAVKRWFIRKSNTKWLLVVDNVDDLSFDIDEYIPASAYGGTVIITSRRPECAEGRCGIEVEQMDDYEAEQLLRNSSKQKNSKLSPIEQESLRKIIHKLGNLPLALEQVGTYIHRRQYSFSRYFREFEESIPRVFNSNQKRRSGKHNLSVFAAWELSFEAIQRENPAAADLFLLCGYLDNRDIPEELLQKGLRLPEHDVGLAESIECLFSYSLIKRNVDDRNDSFSLHPLVHQWAQCRTLEPESRAEKALQAFLVVTSAIHILEEEERQATNWIFERRIMPHITAIQKSVHIKEESFTQEEVQRGAHAFASVFEYHQKLDLAAEWYMRILNVEEKVLGPDHPNTLTTVHNMASVLQNQGQYDSALEWYKRALAGREKSLGPDNPSTLTTVNDMASVLQEQGQYKSALEWYKRALAGREKSLGPDHPSTLTTVNDMALVLKHQGQYDSALEWYKRVLARFEKSLGPDHPYTLTTVHNMASVLQNQGQYESALEWYKRALAGTEKSLGPDHPSTLTTVNNMASVLQNQGQYDSALEWYKRALAGFEKSLGPDHPSTLTTVNDMASLLQEQGQYESALEWYKRALAGKEKSLGPDHLSTLTTVNDMALVLKQQGQYESALEWYKRALAGTEKSRGPDHPSTLTMVHNMALVLKQQGQYDSALEWYKRALAGREKSLGPDHPSTLTTVHNMASVLQEQGQYESALEWYKRALAGREKSLGPSHPSTLTTVNDMAFTLWEQQDHVKAVQYWERAYDGRCRVLGDSHPHTQSTLHVLTTHREIVRE